MKYALVASLLLVAGRASAQATGGSTGENSVPDRADSIASAARRVRAAPAPAERARFDQPRWVMLRSLVVPGWGQLHNHAYLKAAGCAGVEGWLGTRLVSDNRSLARLRREVDDARAAGDDSRAAAATTAYNTRLDRVVSSQWMLAGVLAYALLDSYVDAHFRKFKVEFEHDPALPEGFSTGTGARLLLRWGF